MTGNTDTQTRMKNAALAYAQRLGWYVFPLAAGTKIPATKHGLLDATDDTRQIARWWDRWPDANIGLNCGRSGLLAVDLDTKHDDDGPGNWRALLAENGITAPETPLNLTPSGGVHELYRLPDGVSIPSKNGIVAPGVDTKSDGGYIVLPPSEISERWAEQNRCAPGVYAWDVAAHPLDAPTTMCPDAMIELLLARLGTSRQADETRQATERYRAPDVIRDGHRNEELFRLASSLRTRGLSETEILAAITAANAERCQPPLEETELATIANSAARYPPKPNRAAPPLDAEQEPPNDEPPPDSADAAELPRLDAGDKNLARITTAAWRAILRANDAEPFLFRFGGMPARLERDDRGQPVVRHLTKERMRGTLANVATWYKMVKLSAQDAAEQGRQYRQVDALPPVYVVDTVLATPNPPLPVLTGIVGAPVFGPDGRLQLEPGYHASSQTYYMPADGLRLGSVPEKPSEQELDAARRLILSELLGEFPFTSDAERAHAVALLLLPFARQMIDGATPLHLIEKPSPGTGASLMVNALHLVATGHPVTAMTEGRTDDEWRKRLTAKLLSAPAMVFVDNLRRRLDSAALSAAITAPVWEDRLLGKSEMVRMPVLCGWVATGNNPALSNEMARRTIRIRLDARQDRPWLRTGFKHPRLGEWVKQERAELVRACLIIVQYWRACQAPSYTARHLGMFESWGRVMGGILANAGIPGFLANLEEFYDSADAESATWRACVNIWWNVHTKTPVGTAELFQLLQENELDIDLGNGTERSQKTRLGRLLSQQRDRVYQIQPDETKDDKIALRITDCGTFRRARQYALQPIV